MSKVWGFFKSIRLKFILIYILLILIADTDQLVLLRKAVGNTATQKTLRNP